ERAVSGVLQPSNFGERMRIAVYGRMPPLQNVGPGYCSDDDLVVFTSRAGRAPADAARMSRLVSELPGGTIGRASRDRSLFRGFRD
ncbi:MAG TPA: hypothetical protein VMQ93_09185, partial [Novosphingobium sp.]|nr:hypothetical protein [Novosphingobium sp.]